MAGQALPEEGETGSVMNGNIYLVSNTRAAIFAVRNYYHWVRISGIAGGLAQLARALAWHVRGHRFDPDILHQL